jgi:hypothetical protein
MIRYALLDPYIERYQDIDTEPLRVTLELVEGSPLVGYDPLMLDNLLARAVVNEATSGEGLPPGQGAYLLPVPLRCLWQDGEGYPLWAATPFVPEGEQFTDTYYYHKRQQPGMWTGTKSGQLKISSTNGRYMERRVPTPSVTAERFVATCIGDAEEVARLLHGIAHAGKRRAVGFGEVRRWVIDDAPEFRLVAGGKLTRNLPEEAIDAIDDYGLLPRYRPEGATAPVGWTPPYWLPALYRPGWWMGAPVECQIDWYAEAPV